MLARVALPDRVREAALFPDTDLPDPPPEHPFTLIRRDGYSIGMFAGMTHGNVAVRAIAPDDVERVVGDARRTLADHGKGRGAWMAPEAASPADLGERLKALGMIPFDEPPMEPRFASMALITPPEPGPAGVDARLAETFAEYQAGHAVAHEAFEMSEEDRVAREAHEQVAWELELSSGDFRTFVATIDGEVVGAAAVIYGANAVYLVGGSTRPDTRGRGVYRALVRARWDAAVAHGTPALSVSAGRMSRPILERLGFATVGWTDCLLDRFS
jgi:GNAT superfamily N-acetyltransferase